MPGLTLTMRDIHNHDVSEDLDANLDFIETGNMGACVCVIVGWGPNAAGRMANMRGFHGSGGIDAIDFPNLFHDVTNHASTHIWMISGQDNGYLNGQTGGIVHNRQTVRNAVRDAGLDQVIQIHCIHAVVSAKVDRFRHVTTRAN